MSPLLQLERAATTGSRSAGLRLLLHSSVEPCGCFVGVYEHWNGSVVRVIEQVNYSCREAHQSGEPATAH